jgi:hypothetical protein
MKRTLAAILLSTLVTPSIADNLEVNEDYFLYGGPSALVDTGRTSITTAQRDWSNDWETTLGGEPPVELEPGQTGLMVVSPYPGHWVSLLVTSAGVSWTVRCEFHPLPQRTAHVAPSAWAAGLFNTESLILENCP